MSLDLQTTAWDNSNVYKDFKDPQITKDLETVSEQTESLKPLADKFEQFNYDYEMIPLARKAYRINLDLKVTLQTLGSYAYTATTVNSKHQEAKELFGRVTKLTASLQKTIKPLQIYLLRAPKEYLDQFLEDESVNESRFQLRHAKKHEAFLLSVPEETLIEGLSVDGLHAWGQLYRDISGAIQVNIKGQMVGLAEAANMTMQEDRSLREEAYRGINEAWSKNEIPAAAILNSINGWRTETYLVRSKKKELHFLDGSCHGQRIERKTLDTMMETTLERKDLGQKAIRLMAKEFRIEKLSPWDLSAPYPSKRDDQKITFPRGMGMIIQAFENFDPEMAAFAKMMFDKKWIDSSPSENRASGAYCTGFLKVREPRVFITFEGSMSNVITLAHEIGHAYHSWVMRDLKPTETNYSMPLAETASIFAETLVRDFILENSKTVEEKKAILWQDLESAAALLINIPSRFEFEKRFMEARKEKVLSPDEIKTLMSESWATWYGDTLTEYNDMFWASKLHFTLTGQPFYNYTYLFGYLFSLSIYSRRFDEGKNFKTSYIELLRDTGIMTAEEVVKKHLKDDLGQKKFWLNSFSIVEKSINHYEKL